MGTKGLAIAAAALFLGVGLVVAGVVLAAEDSPPPTTSTLPPPALETTTPTSVVESFDCEAFVTGMSFWGQYSQVMAGAPSATPPPKEWFDDWMDRCENELELIIGGLIPYVGAEPIEEVQ